ncbi:O-methylsterigmatocystin oxidoreductase [Coprinopsis cinerea okayama7|uniref:O-methylsterigmatocystin oxidoreductase n=1 Tax=Coprinopsis cinerea (strain Okayama-7 / 130 / ATCC MYA-4618 / FGSC 9003) TaxID=240176 RepID=A8PAA9_COPC7|nr:O-methylsterigmatocystin oxidoreductase [Coprinopsis cinerea okayama7\|eukprot:XP_001839948.1 O-methylsterigmatocystin oxidoreductase [Coprinopsis cinerea okayama7\
MSTSAFEALLSPHSFSSELKAYVLAVLPVFLYFAAKSISSGKNAKSKQPLPPGPKGKPIIGNMLDIPQVKPWLVYKQWGETYGNIVHVNALGQSIVVINKLDQVIDLLEKRSTNYSDRPGLPMLDMMDYSFSFGLMPYGQDWRRHRKVFHQYLHAHMVPRYNPIQEQEVIPFARNLLTSPEKFLLHTRVLFASIIMRASYGFEKVNYDDELISDAENLLHAFAEVIVPGRYLVNHIPILRHIPSWFPGAGFKRKVWEMSRLSEKSVCMPFEMAKRRGRENALPSMATDLIEQLPAENDPKREEEETVVKKAIANAYVAGADTTVGTGHALFLALAMNPEVQRKAQAEIDAVIGPGRLPLIRDRERLPYVQAVVKEVTRWHTALPIGVPRKVTEDDEYMGYHIPKGAILMVNQWAINHDPELYDDPMTFNPDRFIKDGKLNPEVPDPTNVAFGFGRRICPGRHFSNDSVFILAATLFALFDIKQSKDEAGNPIPLELDVTSDTVSAPLPFKCDIVPRSAAAVSLIQKS